MPELPGLTDAMKGAIGTSSAPTLYEVTTQGIRTFARAVGYTDSMYYDEDEARARGHRALPAPPGFVGMPVYDPRTHVDDTVLPFECPFERELHGGETIEPRERVYAGDLLELVSTVKDIRLRNGSLGQMMILDTDRIFTRKSDAAVVVKISSTEIWY